MAEKNYTHVLVQSDRAENLLQAFASLPPDAPAFPPLNVNLGDFETVDIVQVMIAGETLLRIPYTDAAN